METNPIRKNPTQPPERCATQKCANSMGETRCATRRAQPQMVVKQWLCRNGSAQPVRTTCTHNLKGSNTGKGSNNTVIQ